MAVQQPCNPPPKTPTRITILLPLQTAAIGIQVIPSFTGLALDCAAREIKILDEFLYLSLRASCSVGEDVAARKSEYFLFVWLNNERQTGAAVFLKFI
jgi:hypothetical protein